MRKIKTITSGLSFLVLASLAVGCTKPLFKQNVETDATSLLRPEAKSLIDTKADYLYVPSSLYSSRTTNATFPMYMGEAKIVRLGFDENNIQVSEIDTESQFAGNPVNNKPVLSIPINNVDYKCSIDAYGNCTNHQEVDNSRPWADRSYMQIVPDRFAVQEINFLPVDISNTFYPCYQVVDSNFIGYKLEKDAINIDVEKVYHTNVSDKKCSSTIKTPSDIVFSVVYHYSLVKLNTLASPNYKSFSYSRKEESTFGFFDTDTLKLGVDGNQLQTGEKLFLNRWNPAKKSLVYNLTANFNKPENAKIKTATLAAVQSINNSLAKANAAFQIVLQDAPADFNPGDLRSNSIIMVEEPLNYGILGYGPTAANPRTGEIVNGHVAMYLGVMKTTIQRAYEDQLAERKPGAAPIQKSTKQTVDSSSGAISIANSSMGPMSLAPELVRASDLAVADATPASQATVSPADFSQQILSMAARAERLNVHKVSMQEILNIDDNSLARDQIMSLHCYYDADAANVEGAIEDEIGAVLKSVDYKAWADLSDAERTKVIDTLMPFLWIPTLTHEMGHNLGLRHNFAGSEDKDNFYSADELKAMGLTRQFSYSSVMDYGYHSNKELQIMGKYDIAALRFGYAEQVEVQKDDKVQIIPLAQYRADASAKLKAYKYCTDENVDVNPNCKRFDEGTTLTEIATHWMNYYEDIYAHRNFRNGLQDFSIADDAAAASRLKTVMFNLRMIFERYDDIKQTYNLADNAPEWQKYDFLKDLKAATTAAANFYISILQTPDTLCAVAQTSAPDKIIAAVPIRKLSTNAISCFDSANIQLKAGYAVVGQGGKSFQSKKDPASENAYLDQVDVRGVWINKLLALRMLTLRQTGVEPFDVYTDNFLDITDLRPLVQKALTDLLLDEVVASVPIFTVTGQTLVAQLPVKMYNASPSLNSHMIMNPLSSDTRRIFGLPNDNIEFQAQIAKMLKGYLPSQSQLDDPTSLLNAITVKSSLNFGDDPAQYVSTQLGLSTLVVNKKSTVALALVSDAAAIDLLDKISPAKVIAIAKDVAAGKKAPPKTVGDEKAAYALKASVLQKYVGGVLDERPFYSMVLRALAP